MLTGARVGLLTTSFPRREGDVPGQFVLGFARSLAACGNELLVLAPEPARGDPPALGLPLHWVRYAPRPLERTFYGAGVLDNVREAPLSALGLLPFVLALRRALHARDFDALVSHWAVPCALVAGEYARARGVPHLSVLHSGDVFVLEKLPRRLGRLLATRIASEADALLFSSRDLRRRYLALLSPLRRAETAQHAHVCAMGIDPSPPSEGARARLGLTRFTALTMSRLVPIKGLEYAIDAARTADVELVIAGDGPARARLERHAHGTRTRFVGSIHGAAKSEWLSAADAFLLPSVPTASGRVEGMPSALLEAMEHGLPVIASDVGGVSDVVRHGDNGFLVPPGNADAIAEFLALLRDDPLRARLGAAARETAAQYHWSVLGPRFAELLDP